MLYECKGYPLSSTNHRGAGIIYSMLPLPAQAYPRKWSGFWSVSSDEACAAYLERLRLAEWLCVPKLRQHDATVPGQPHPVDVQRLPAPEHRDRRHYLRQDAYAVARMSAAAWYITNQKQGVSALGLQRVLGLGSSQTAWTMLHRFRRAMVRPDRNRLKGLVEVDEAYLAITDRDQPISAVGRKNNTSKVLIVLGVEIRLIGPKDSGASVCGAYRATRRSVSVPFVQTSLVPAQSCEPTAQQLTDRYANLAMTTTAPSYSDPTRPLMIVPGGRASGCGSFEALDTRNTPRIRWSACAAWTLISTNSCFVRDRPLIGVSRGKLLLTAYFDERSLSRPCDLCRHNTNRRLSGAKWIPLMNVQ